MDQSRQVLRRKVAAARPAEGPGPETAARVWRVGLARAARELAGLPVTPDDIRDERRSLAEVLDLLPESGLYAVLEGPGSTLGLLCLSPDLVCALIEAQTLGAALPQAAPPRRLTRTDAALCAVVIDAALAFLENGLQDAPDLSWAGGYRYASFLEEARPLSLLLEDIPYRSLWMAGTIGPAGRPLSALLCLPAEGRAPQRAAAPLVPPSAADQHWAQGFQRSLGGAEVTLTAILARCRLGLEASLALKPGDLLTLGTADLNALTLATEDGEDICTVRLGRQGPLRAVKLAPTDAPAAQPMDPPLTAEPLLKTA